MSSCLSVRLFRRGPLLAVIGVLGLLPACQSTKPGRPAVLTNQPVAATSPAALFRSVQLRQHMVPAGHHGRSKIRPMKPSYITIHSTQNFAASANADKHATALNHGALRGNNSLGYLIWHFTVDDSHTIQHMPLNERGEHADFDGPGNRYSIGIEMCENRGSNRAITVDRSARLAAILMHTYDIPLRNVVPHYHWPRYRYKDAHKNCPHFLLDNGKPGKTWRTFLARVNYYHRIARSDANGLASGQGGPNPRALQAYFERGSMVRRGFLAGLTRPNATN